MGIVELFTGLIGLLLAGAGLFWYGGKRKEDKIETQKKVDYHDTKQRVKDTPVNTERDAALERLRRTGKLRGDS